MARMAGTSEQIAIRKSACSRSSAQTPTSSEPIAERQDLIGQHRNHSNYYCPWQSMAPAPAKRSSAYQV